MWIRTRRALALSKPAAYTIERHRDQPQDRTYPDRWLLIAEYESGARSTLDEFLGHSEEHIALIADGWLALLEEAGDDPPGDVRLAFGRVVAAAETMHEFSREDRPENLLRIAREAGVGKIFKIKKIRELTGWGLKESKQFVDEYGRDHA